MAVPGTKVRGGGEEWGESSGIQCKARTVRRSECGGGWEIIGERVLTHCVHTHIHSYLSVIVSIIVLLVLLNHHLTTAHLQ